MTTLPQVLQNQAQKEVIINNNIAVLEQAGVLGHNPATTAGLVFGYYGGYYQDSLGVINSIANGTITLTASATNYIEFDRDTGTVSKNTTGFTTGRVPMYVLATDTVKITTDPISSGNRRTQLFALQNSSIGGSSGNEPIWTVRPEGHSGLNWGYYGGEWVDGLGTTRVFSDGTVTITNSSTNYIYYVNNSGGTSLSTNTTGFPVGCIPIALVAATGGNITSTTDKRIVQLQQHNTSFQVTSKQSGTAERYLACFNGNPSGAAVSKLLPIYEPGAIIDINQSSTAGVGGVALRGGDFCYDGNTIYTVADSGLLTKNSTGIETLYIYLLKSGGTVSFVKSNTIPATYCATNDAVYLYSITWGGDVLDSIIDNRVAHTLRRYINRYYEASTATITANTTFNQTHGLVLASGIKEIEWEILLYCKTAEHGYAIDDEVKFMTGPTVLTAADPARHTGRINATTLSCRICDAIYIQHRTASTINAVTLANWGIRWRARITQ